MNLAEIKGHADWVKMWAAKGSLHFDSHLGDIWTGRKNIAGESVYRQVVFFYTSGVTDCWATKSDREHLGERLRSLARQDSGYIDAIASDLLAQAGRVSSFIAAHRPELMTVIEYDEFWNIVYDYYLPHISVKYVVDYLTPEELEAVLPKLEKARLAAEPIYRDIENYVESLSVFIAEKTFYEKEMILAATKEELREFFQSGILPEKDILKERYVQSVLVCNESQKSIFTGSDAEKIKNAITPMAAAKTIEGQTAYGGKVRGRVRIILNPEAGSSFAADEILVTGMTRPEFLPLLKKAAGFITDSGGILSHAAIIARELKKPCIIGTQNATSILRDGDLVEVDAERGIVRILS